MSESLRAFLAHALEMETEAGERYQELAEAMGLHNNPEVAEFFSTMAAEASVHIALVKQHADGQTLPILKAWEFDWPDVEAPESTSYESTHYRMTKRQAMQLALANEKAAEQYYRQLARETIDDQTQNLAAQFAEEERQHAAGLERALRQLSIEPTHHRQDDDDPHVPE